jgi:hypothetical protein
MSSSAQFEDKVRSSVASRTDDKDIQGFLVGHFELLIESGGWERSGDGFIVDGFVGFKV